MPPKKLPKFKKDHCALEYGLKIMARDSSTSAVTDVRCQFCTFYGREAHSGAKRKRTTVVKHYKRFRVQYYKQHVIQQHPAEWESYQALDKEGKKQFFDGRPVVVNQLTAHWESDGGAYVFLFDRNIIEVVIGELLFDPDSADNEFEISRERALALFKLREDADSNASDNSEQDTDKGAYSVTIKSSRQFRLVLKFIGCGASFRLTSRLLGAMRDETGLCYLSGVSDVKVSQYVRVVQLQPTFKRLVIFSIRLGLSQLL